MQLFILGPAFGLPSIDAECNAAVALLQLRVKDNYELIPAHDTTQRLPLLLDGQAKVSGFNNIVRHMANKRISNEHITLDAKQQADSLAIASFIESSAQTLLDISLYVGFENYRLATRPAFSKILPSHVNYIIPPRRRNAARTRTDHLGISSIDVDNVHEDMSNRPPGMDGVGKEPGFEAETQKRASLLLPRKETLKGLLQRPEHAAVFKLHALADNFFGPLEDMIGEQSYLLNTQHPTSVDCLAYGFLSLMLYPRLAQDWLESTMCRKYPRLVAYTKRLHALLGTATQVDRVLALSSRPEQNDSTKLKLPWRTAGTSTASRTMKEIIDGIWGHLPLVAASTRLQLMDAKRFSFFDRNLQVFAVSTVTSIAVAGYLAVRFGLIMWPHGENMHIFGAKRLSDYGDLGAALAGINFIGAQA